MTKVKKSAGKDQPIICFIGTPVFRRN